MTAVILILTVLMVGVSASPALADKAPIVGKIKQIDPNAQTLTVTSTAKGKTRDVVVDVKPGTKIVRSAGAAGGGSAGTAAQPTSLAELKTGWAVSIVTRHEGRREVADTVRVVHE